MRLTANEIREEAKKAKMEEYRKYSKMFSNNPTMELNSILCNMSLSLVNSYGLTWEEVEALEF